MTAFTEQAKRYTAYHHTRLIWYTHLIGIPLIFFSLLILFGFLHLVVPNLFDIKFSDILVVALLIYYFFLNWKLALVLTPIFIILLWLSDLINYAGPTAFAVWAFIIIFLLGCAFQLAGHLIEGSRPAFSNHPKDSLAAPMFITAELFFKAGKMNSLKKEIYGETFPETHKEEVEIEVKPSSKNKIE
ncbi:Mpo1 family 2-hydroxy fatty acid dioxygenase [Legionella impletisoli]|uniref:Membrane protein n=1 Tax=Legionella impletisoli TaxID=343510 RepID=A0A917JYH2_9GAMM|nr:Mpo1-like protein [Legionella impletisoli]GGI92755.1 membrane protein [Legionella impletisoli]